MALFECARDSRAQSLLAFNVRFSIFPRDLALSTSRLLMGYLTIAKLVVHRVPTDDNGMETGNSTVTLVVSNFRSAPYIGLGLGDSEFPPRSSLRSFLQ